MLDDVQAPDLQSLCETGQQHLLATDYWQAERLLEQAEAVAYAKRDWDTLSRVYMPLQESRRQRRQLSGEGAIDLSTRIARSADDLLDAESTVTTTPHGQLLIAGFGTIAPAIAAREIVRERMLYLDVFLGAAYSVGGSVAVLIVPRHDIAVPPPGEYSLDDLIRRAPPHSILLPAHQLPVPQPRGDTKSFAYTMDLFEQLHRPFLAMADAASDPEQKIALYRATIEVDYAAEFAHQRLSNIARDLSRQR